jgi:hypothetical protein
MVGVKLSVVRRHNQYGVIRTAREREPAIFYRRPVQQDLGIHGIIIVASRQRRIAGAHYHGRALSVKIRRVGHGATLLQRNWQREM